MTIDFSVIKHKQNPCEAYFEIQTNVTIALQNCLYFLKNINFEGYIGLERSLHPFTIPYVYALLYLKCIITLFYQTEATAHFIKDFIPFKNPLGLSNCSRRLRF